MVMQHKPHVSHLAVCLFLSVFLTVSRHSWLYLSHACNILNSLLEWRAGCCNHFTCCLWLSNTMTYCSVCICSPSWVLCPDSCISHLPFEEYNFHLLCFVCFSTSFQTHSLNSSCLTYLASPLPSSFWSHFSSPSLHLCWDFLFFSLWQ